MKLPLSLMLAVLLLATAAQAEPLGSGRKPLKEVRSLNTRYELRVTPGRARGDRKPCAARLYERGREIWNRQLVNDVAPVYGAVSDDGKFTVTLDEYRRGGARNALVIYGDDGKLLRHFVLPDLLQQEDWRHVKVKGQAVLWLPEAQVGFDDASTHFIIDFAWGRQVAIDLQRLRVVRDGVPAERSDVPPEIAALLETPAANEPVSDPPSVEELARRSGIAQSDLERLMEMGLLDPDDLAAKLEEQTEKPAGDEQPALVAETPAAPQTQPAAEAALADKSGPQELTPEDLQQGLAAAASGPRAPDPDPANPVNYLDWINSQSPQGGIDARPLYDQAIARFTPWDEQADGDVLERALKGDPQALNAPELSAWLDANREALALYRTAAQADYRGWNFHSEDGRVMSVLLPDLAVHRKFSRALVLDAQRAMNEGRTQDALDAYAAVGSAAAHVGSGPTLIENLVGVAMSSLASESLLDQMAAHGAELDFSSAAAQLERSLRPTASTAHGVQMERSMYHDVVQSIFNYDAQRGAYTPDIQETGEMLGIARGSPPTALEQAANYFKFGAMDFHEVVREGNQYYDSLVSAMQGPYVSAQPMLKAAEAAAEKGSPVLRTFAPALSRAFFTNSRGEAGRRATLLVANLQAYRQQHGSYPESLEAFGERDITVDPFSGGRFSYRPSGDSFVLYSTGGNGVDDGGAHDPSGETSDLVYWPRPARP